MSVGEIVESSNNHRDIRVFMAWIVGRGTRLVTPIAQDKCTNIVALRKTQKQRRSSSREFMYRAVPLRWPTVAPAISFPLPSFFALFPSYPFPVSRRCTCASSSFSLFSLLPSSIAPGTFTFSLFDLSLSLSPALFAFWSIYGQYGHTRGDKKFPIRVFVPARHRLQLH